MITGSVNSEHEALVRLTVLGPTGERADVEALVDTGSDGYLTLPPDLIERLQLPWLQSGQTVLADTNSRAKAFAEREVADTIPHGLGARAPRLRTEDS
jgi:predicted aspartyl protease